MTKFDLLNKWGPTVQSSDHIWTWTEPEVLAYLSDEASKAKFAVELGVYLGRSSKVMLDASPCLHLWSVDADLVPGVFFTAAQHLKKEIFLGRCEMMRGDSNRAAGMLQHMAGKLDLVWVDDGHSYEDVTRDIRAFLPLLRPGGLLCGHDFDTPHNDVARAVIANLPSYELPLPRLWAYRKPL